MSSEENKGPPPPYPGLSGPMQPGAAIPGMIPGMPGAQFKPEICKVSFVQKGQRGKADN